MRSNVTKFRQREYPAVPRVAIEGSMLVIRIPLGDVPAKAIPRIDLVGMESLSIRQRQVFDCVCKGMQNKEIADLFHITLRTVKYHMSEVLRRLSVSSRHELVRFSRD
jgi:DNA-binding NarL/FixJ family response regulator